ncbi:glycosyltransferase [Mailhella sp.]|uniref:glycosyltransferase n=1 Tax=Mailhella sp. TaxID=1981029 RepID=UPI003AB2DB17
MPTMYRVSQNPLIFHCYNFGNVFSPIKQMAPYIRTERNIHFVITLNWSIRPPRRLKQLVESYHRHARKYPRLIVTVLANEPEELELLRQNGVRSELCNQNALLDERCYTIRRVEKRYRAISNSRMAPYKRLELLRDVENCALITYFLDPADHEYEKRILPHAGGERAACPDLICPQFDGRSWQWYDNDQICDALSASRCGVILSAEEGACFAAVEYLLCGLPVVTTPSVGGRDAMFHPDYVVWADPTPESVAAAVEKAIALPISPEEIRERTVALMRRGRETYCRILNAIAREEGVERDFLADWDSFYVNKLFRYMPEPEAVRYLNESGVRTRYTLLHRLHNAHRAFREFLKRR